MAYIGTPVQQALTKVTSQSFNGTGSQTVFTLNRAVNTGEELEVFVNNVQQEPGVGKSYTATGTTLTFDAAPSSGTGNVYVIYRGIAEVTRRLEHDPNAALAATTGTFSDGITVDKNGATVATFDRATSDGTIVDIRKDGTTVGSIGTLASKLTIGSGGTGVRFNYAGLDTIAPWNVSTNALTDGATSLGYAGTRFKDLYLSGGVYLGGTGSANYLDDYEEGTWNPSIGGTATYAASNYGRYTKIGNVVTLQFAIAVTSVGTGSTSSVINLPFTSENIGEVQSGHVSYFGNLATATNFLSFYAGNNATSISFVGNTGNNTTIALNGFSVFGANTSIYGSITYRTA